MGKRCTKRSRVRKASRKERKKRQAEKAREIQLVLDPGEVVAMLQDSLTDFATEMGLRVARLLLGDEVNQRSTAPQNLQPAVRGRIAVRLCERRFPQRAALRYPAGWGRDSGRTDEDDDVE